MTLESLHFGHLDQTYVLSIANTGRVGAPRFVKRLSVLSDYFFESISRAATEYAISPLR